MKKYFAAAAVAVMVFAFSAFAAQINVDGGILQAGEDGNLTCSEDAVVSYTTGFAGNPGGPALLQVVENVTVTFDEACNGNVANVTVLRQKTNDQQNIGALRLAGGVAEITDGTVSFNASGLLAADVERVAIVVTNEGNTNFRRGAFGNSN